MLFDQYTYLHFAIGIVVYFWNISLINWVIIHTIFEIIENTQTGIHIINVSSPFRPSLRVRPKLQLYIWRYSPFGE